MSGCVKFHIREQVLALEWNLNHRKQFCMNECIPYF